MDNKHLSRKKPKEGMVHGKSVSGTIVDIVIIAILCLVVLICIVPMWHVLVSSIYSDPQQLISNEGITWWFGNSVNLEAYRILFQETGGSFADGNVLRGMFNTILYMVVNVVFGLVLNVIAGYCLSRKTKLQNFMKLFCMLSLVFSAGTIPTYIVLRNLGLTGTVWSLVVPSCTNGMFMVLAMNAFLSVPEETVESAKIDGAGHLTTMFKVMLPQARGLIVVIMINTAILHWNSWFQASIYVPNSKDLWPMQLWIREIVETSNQNYMMVSGGELQLVKYLVQFAAIVVSTVPILFAFPFFYRVLEKNTVAGAVKG